MQNKKSCKFASNFGDQMQTTQPLLLTMTLNFLRKSQES